MSGAPAKSPPLSAALMAAGEHLGSDGAKTAEMAEDILDAVPGQQQALLLLVSAYRSRGDIAGACAVLEAMSEELPQLAAVQHELGLLLATQNKHRAAIERFSKVVALEPKHPTAWRSLGDQLALAGDAAAARDAYVSHMKVSVRDLKLLEDAAHGSNSTKAQNVLRQCLAVNPTDVMAMQMLGQSEIWHGRFHSARTLLEQALALAPEHADARRDYALVLNRQLQWRQSIAQIDEILRRGSAEPMVLALKAWDLILLGEYDEAFGLFDAIRPKLMNEPQYWLNYGHALRTVGRSEEAIEAYRRSVTLEPGFGLGWWSLADLKTYRFSPDEVEAMRRQLEREDLSEDSRCTLEFSLGKALEDAQAYAESFEHYRQGNALRRSRVSHDPERITAQIDRTKALFTPEFVARRKGLGCAAADAIFVLGLPRAGSTLIEQICPAIPMSKARRSCPTSSISWPNSEGRARAWTIRRFSWNWMGRL